jgi:hypothetical protein
MNGERQPFGERGERRQEWVKTGELKLLSYNAAGRTDESKLAALQDSIKKYGVIDAIHVCGEDGMVLEGNRRYTAARLLGIPEMLAWAYYGLSEAEKKRLVADVNINKRAHTGPEKFEEELKGSGPVWGKISKSFAEHKRLFGIPRLKELILDHHIGPDGLALCKRAAAFTGRVPYDTWVKAIMNWKIKHNQHYVLTHLLNKRILLGKDGGESVRQKLIRRVEADKPYYREDGKK